MKKYRILITDDDFERVKFDIKCDFDKIEGQLKTLVPECNINFEMVLNDKRCKSLRHYMPANITTAEHSNLKNYELHKQGNQVKVYISIV